MIFFDEIINTFFKGLEIALVDASIFFLRILIPTPAILFLSAYTWAKILSLIFFLYHVAKIKRIINLPKSRKILIFVDFPGQFWDDYITDYLMSLRALTAILGCSIRIRQCIVAMTNNPVQA